MLAWICATSSLQKSWFVLKLPSAHCSRQACVKGTRMYHRHIQGMDTQGNHLLIMLMPWLTKPQLGRCTPGCNLQDFMHMSGTTELLGRRSGNGQLVCT